MAMNDLRVSCVVVGLQAMAMAQGVWTLEITTSPSARSGHSMAYDGQRGRTVMFGGETPGGYASDTWEWNGSAWTLVAATGPSARRSHSMVYDSQRGRIVMFGGTISGGYVGDTWEWNGSTWTLVAAGGPSARTGHSMAYDSQRGRIVMFGGEAPGGYASDTWQWNGSTWTLVATTGPSARRSHSMAYDSQRGRTVMLGGEISGGYAGDTWEWSPSPPGSPGTATAFGSGCGNPTLALASIAAGLPNINSTAQASLSNIPSSLAFVALGWSRTLVGPFALPFSLAGYGMPGCYILQSAEAAAQPVAFTTPSTATYSLQLPNWAGLIGLHVSLQGWAVAPGANPAGTIVSNGLEWTIGY